MGAESTLLERMRGRLIGEIHLGHLRVGDRLPSVRELARDLGADHRAVARAYHELEGEGLVEMRGRSGAYVAHQERLGGEVTEETARWLTAVLGEAYRRRITIRDFPAFVARLTSRLPLRCACIESNLDSSAALAGQLREEFGLEVQELSARLVDDVGRRKRVEVAELPGELRDAHLMVTSTFHAKGARVVAEALEKPLVVMTVAAESSELIQRRLRQGRLSVIVADPAYGERFGALYGPTTAAADGIHVVHAADADAVRRLDRSEPVVATRSARRLLPDLEVPLLLPRYPSISSESAHELIALLIRLNLAEEG